MIIEININKEAISIYKNIQNSQMLIPWPTLYEVFNSDFVMEKIWMSNFEKLLKQTNVIRLEDSKYKELALGQTFYKSEIKNWNISLVDNVIRQILSDLNLKIEYFVTFNKKDFFDILKKRHTTQFYY